MKNITLRKYLIAGGNPTLLVWNCPRAKKREIIKKYLGQVEQVGFVSEKNGPPKLEMMGNELCVNALIALEFSTNQKNKTEINLILKTETINSDTIILPGIGYIISDQNISNVKKFLKQKSEDYNLPAFGLIRNLKNKMAPFVFVKETNSLFNETACGSGSIALNVAKNYANIIQPTGKTISVNRFGNNFKVSAEVTEISL